MYNADHSPPRPVRVLVIGDHGMGKTSLLITHMTGEPPLEYVPEELGPYQKTMVVDGKEYYLDIREQYIYSFELQPGNRHFTPDVVLICAAVRSRASFQNILDKWMPELQFHMPGARLVVVATQTDLRNDERTVRLHSQRGPSHRMVSYEDGVEIAGRAGTRYVECSAHNKENVEGVFEEAVRAAVEEPKVKKKRRLCQVM